MRIDVHQHVWTPRLQAALASRSELPLIEADGADLATVHAAGEHPWRLDVAAESPAGREALLDADGVDLALVAISSPIGIEALPRAAATPLIAAHLDGVAALGPRFAAWGPLLTDAPTPDDVEALAARGCVGISLPAGALSDLRRLDEVGPALAHAAALGLPLFIHPGRAIGDPVRHPDLEEPLWWRALTEYPAGMQAAWLTWVCAGRREHPELTVIFAMLAGLAPLQAERLATRGGPPLPASDPLTFYDSSSYGEDAVAAVARVVADTQLLYGTDRPVLDPLSTPFDGLLKANAGALFARRAAVRAPDTLTAAGPVGSPTAPAVSAVAA